MSSSVSATLIRHTDAGPAITVSTLAFTVSLSSTGGELVSVIGSSALLKACRGATGHRAVGVTAVTGSADPEDLPAAGIAAGAVEEHRLGQSWPASEASRCPACCVAHTKRRSTNDPRRLGGRHERNLRQSQRAYGADDAAPSLPARDQKSTILGERLQR